MDEKRKSRLLMAVSLITVMLTIYVYGHDSFPKPLSIITSFMGGPTAIASGLSNFLGLGIPVYEKPWAVAIANLCGAGFAVWLVDKLWHYYKKDK